MASLDIFLTCTLLLPQFVMLSFWPVRLVNQHLSIFESDTVMLSITDVSLTWYRNVEFAGVFMVMEGNTPSTENDTAGETFRLPTVSLAHTFMLFWPAEAMNVMLWQLGIVAFTPFSSYLHTFTASLVVKLRLVLSEYVLFCGI